MEAGKVGRSRGRGLRAHAVPPLRGAYVAGVFVAAQCPLPRGLPDMYSQWRVWECPVRRAHTHYCNHQEFGSQESDTHLPSPILSVSSFCRF